MNAIEALFVEAKEIAATRNAEVLKRAWRRDMQFCPHCAYPQNASKAKFEERRKLVERLAKLDKAIEKAINSADYDDLKKFEKGGDEKEEKGAKEPQNDKEE